MDTLLQIHLREHLRLLHAHHNMGLTSGLHFETIAQPVKLCLGRSFR